MVNDSADSVRVRWRGQTSVPRYRYYSTLLSAFLVLAIAAGLGIVFGFVSFVRPTPSPYFVPIWKSQSGGNQALIHGPVEYDRLALLTDNLFPNSAEQLGQDPGQQLIREKLESLKHRSATESVVIYLSAFAIVNPQGEIELVDRQIDSTDSSEQLNLNFFLKSIRACPCRKKLLVLDICWPISDPTHGVFSDDVASRIHDILESNDDDGLLCLSSCSPGQVAWSILNPRRSVFGYFFEQGLLGQADGFDRHAPDGRVSIVELANYLASHVDEYSSRAFPIRQTPKLYGTGKNFELVATPSRKYTPFEAGRECIELPDWISNAWRQRDKVLESNAISFDTRFVRRIESEILNAEMNWRRGGKGSLINSRLIGNMELLTRRYNSGMSTLGRSRRAPAPATRIAVGIQFSE